MDQILVRSIQLFGRSLETFTTESGTKYIRGSYRDHAYTVSYNPMMQTFALTLRDGAYICATHKHIEIMEILAHIENGTPYTVTELTRKVALLTGFPLAI